MDCCKLIIVIPPFVQENPQSRVTATDVSPTAVRLFEDAAQRAGIAADRVRAFACNSADASAGDFLLSGALAYSLPSQARIACCMWPQPALSGSDLVTRASMPA